MTVAIQQQYLDQIQRENEMRRQGGGVQAQPQLTNLQNMHQQQQAQQQGGAAAPQEVIRVTAPEGSRAGTLLNVVHNGQQYHATVPAGVPPGAQFFMTVPSTRPAPLQQQSAARRQHQQQQQQQQQQSPPPPKGRGNRVNLPDDFLRPPDWANGGGGGFGAGGLGEVEGGMSDEQLAVLLQDEMLLAELSRNPEFAGLDLRELAAMAQQQDQQDQQRRQAPQAQAQQQQTGARAAASSSRRPGSGRSLFGFSRGPPRAEASGAGVAMPGASSTAMQQAHAAAAAAEPDQGSTRDGRGAGATQGEQIESDASPDGGGAAGRRRSSGSSGSSGLKNKLKAFARGFNRRRAREYDQVQALDATEFGSHEVSMPWNDQGDGSAEMVTFQPSSSAVHISGDSSASSSSSAAAAEEPEFAPTGPSGGEAASDGLTLYQGGGGVLTGDPSGGGGGGGGGAAPLLRGPSGDNQQEGDLLGVMHVTAESEEGSSDVVPEQPVSNVTFF
jgi:hypothetical protein